MEGDLTWSDVEDVVGAVSVRLLQDDTMHSERPSKRRCLADLSLPNPTPAPDALPDPSWPGWREIATEMELNASHGPDFVRGVARLHAEQRRHYLLPARVRAGSMPLIHSQLQRLSATLRLAQTGAVVASRQAAPSLQQQRPSSSSQQPQEPAASVPATDDRQPLMQWPAGLPTATQLLGSQADEPTVSGAMEFAILGKDWRARKHRGKEVVYLLQFCGAAEGDEDWISERRIRREHPNGADMIAEYERALHAGELDESQQQSQQQNPGAFARMSQQQGGAALAAPASAPVGPLVAPVQLPDARTTVSTAASAAAVAAAEPQQQEQQQQREQPVAESLQLRATRDPRAQLRRSQPAAPSAADAAPAASDTVQPLRSQPHQQQLPAGGSAAMLPAPQHDSGGSAAAAAQQQPVELQAASQAVAPSQPDPTDSQWLAGGTQTQAPQADAAALQFVPFTQPSQPDKAGDGLHRQPLPAQPSPVAVVVPAAAAAGTASPAQLVGAPAMVAVSAAAPAAAPAAAAQQAAVSDVTAAPAAAVAAAAPAAAPQAAVQPQPAQGAQPAPVTNDAADDAENELPSPEVQRGVLKLLRRLSGRALQWVQAPQQQQQQQQQQQSVQEPPQQPQGRPEQPQPSLEARPPQQQAPAGREQQEQQQQQPDQQNQQLVAVNQGAAAMAGAAEASRPAGAAAVQQVGGSPQAAAGTADGRDHPIELSDSSSEEDEDKDDMPEELRAHLQPDAWAGARITGARKFEDGMDITVVWDEDGYTAAVPNGLLKSKPHCRLKLIEFYESKIKAVSRKKKK